MINASFEPGRFHTRMEDGREYDFGPASQRKWFYQLLKECKAVADIEAGNLDAALRLTSSRWASFPYAPYNQHRNTVEFMTTEFVNAGGVLAQP